jgi:hypothetical protein
MPLKILLFLKNNFIKNKKSLQQNVKGLEMVWLPGLVSESVLLWDKIGLEMKRVRAGHIGIYLTP